MNASCVRLAVEFQTFPGRLTLSRRDMTYMKWSGVLGPQMRTGRCFAGAGAEPLLGAAQRTALTHARAWRLHLSRYTVPDCAVPSTCLRTRASPFDRPCPKPVGTCPGTEWRFCISPAFDVSSATFICRSARRRRPAQAHARACAADAAAGCAGNGHHGAAASPAAAAGANRARAQPKSCSAADAGAHARHAADAGVGAAPGRHRRRTLRRPKPHRRLPATHGHCVPDAAFRRPSGRPPGCAVV